MRVGKLVRTRASPGRLRVVGLLRDRSLSDPEVGGAVFLTRDWAIVGSCPATFVEVEANVNSDWPLDEMIKMTDDSPHPMVRWQLSAARIVAVLGDDWLGDKTCERDVPPWPDHQR